MNIHIVGKCPCSQSKIANIMILVEGGNFILSFTKTTLEKTQCCQQIQLPPLIGY